MIELSIVMPVYNEEKTVSSAVDRVLAVEYPCPVELVVVDDGSSDATRDLLAAYTERGVRVIHHEINQGKGAAVRTGAAAATGTHMIILDADLEYSPADIPALLEPVLAGRADHVFGTRVFGLNTRFRSFRFAVGGRALTLAANVLYDSMLTDLHTCLKLVPVAHFRALTFTETGFGLDTELTARLLRGGVRPWEVPVTYDGRSVTDGKKINWRDGVRCLQILARVRMDRWPQLLPSLVPGVGPVLTLPTAVPAAALPTALPAALPTALPTVVPAAAAATATASALPAALSVGLPTPRPTVDELAAAWAADQPVVPIPRSAEATDLAGELAAVLKDRSVPATRPAVGPGEAPVAV